MGVKGLWQLLEPAGRPVTLESLEGKILAIDVSIWLNKAAKGMRDKFGNPVHNGHLLMMLQRICKLLFYKIKPIFVFDGGVPELKKKTLGARKDRQYDADKKAGKAREKMLQNYVKSVALGVVTGKKSLGSVNAKQEKEPDLFELPPLPTGSQTTSQSSSDEFEETEQEKKWVESLQSEGLQSLFEHLHDIDMESDEFKSLPPEIQHELLVELKESHRRKYNQKPEVMPEKADEFSNFQLAGLLRRGQITKQIDVLRKDMGTKASGDIMQMYSDDGDATRKEVEARRVVSEPKSHYIFIKSAPRRGGNTMFAGVSEEYEEEDEHDTQENDTFQKLEREPHQFKEMYLDDAVPVVFMSESSDESCLLSPEINVPFQFPVTKQEISKQKDIEGSISKKDSILLLGDKKEVREKCVVGYTTRNASFSDSQDEASGSNYTGITELKENSPKEQEKVVGVQKDSKISKGAEIVTQTDHLKTERNILNKGVSDENKSQAKEICQLPEDQNRTPTRTRKLSDSEMTEESFTTKRIKMMEDNKVGSDGMSDDMKISNNVEVIDLETQGPAMENNIKIISPNIEIEAEENQEESPESTSKRKHLTDEDKKRIEEFQKSIEGKTKEDLSEVQKELEEQQKGLQKERQKLTRAATSVVEEMYNDVQELLRLFGIPYVTSPMEAEAQCAALDQADHTDGSVTDDSDIFLFGGRRVYKNIFNQNKYAEFYSLKDIENTLFLNREKMIAVAYLTGSDYTEGVRGVGGVTALEILQEFPGDSLESLARISTWYDYIRKEEQPVGETKVKTKMRTFKLPVGFPNLQVWEAYTNPAVEESDESFEWDTPDLAAIRDFARDKLNWRSSQTDELLLPVLKKWNTIETQKKLTSLFPTLSRTSKKKSKRIQRVLDLIRSNKHERARKNDEKVESLSTQFEKGKMVEDIQETGFQKNDNSVRNCMPSSSNASETSVGRGATRIHSRAAVGGNRMRIKTRASRYSRGGASSRISALRKQAQNITKMHSEFIGKNFARPVDKVQLSSSSSDSDD